MGGTQITSFYRPSTGGMADFAIIRGPDGYHLFHDHFIPSDPERSQKHLGHAFSRNLIEWKQHDPVLNAIMGTWEGRSLYSPAVICHRGVYHMFYVGVSENGVQRIGCALSDDLWHWTKFVDNPVWEPGYTSWANWHRGVPHENRHGSCRDVAIVNHCGDYLMYYTARCKDSRMSCVAACQTFDDPFNWYDRGPVLIRDISLEGTGETESPHLIYKPRWGMYYLFFNHGLGIKCVWSRNPLHFQASEEIMFLPEHNGFEHLGESNGHEYFSCFGGNGFCIGEIMWREQRPEYQPLEDMRSLEQFAMRPV